MIKEKFTSKEVNRMPSSNRVIKASHTSNETNRATISTEYKSRQEEIFDGEEKEENKNNLQASNISKELLKEAEEEKEALLLNAKKEIKAMKEEKFEESQKEGYQKGYEEGLEKGQEAGYQDAFDKGYQDAVAEVEIELELKRDRAAKMLEEAHEKMLAYESERKDDFLKLATHMAEKIVNDYIDQSSEGLLAIAKTYFYQLDKEEEFVTITVHPDQRKALEENLDEIKSISPATRFMILGSPSIEENGMLIESSHSIIDLQIKKQLEQMLEEFQEMERTVDA